MALQSIPARAPEAARPTPEAPPPTLDELVAAARGGDVPAFEALYRSCSGRVYALCLRLSGDASTAETLVQDVFVRAWEKLASFRGDSAFHTWLHRLAVNLVLQERRGSTRRADRELAVADEPRPALPQGRVDAGVDLERAIASLPTKARAVFVLYEIEGYAHEEIARVMNSTVGTSKAQLHRARQLLREALK